MNVSSYIIAYRNRFQYHFSLIFIIVVLFATSNSYAINKTNDLAIVKLASPLAPHSGLQRKLSIIVENHGVNKIDSFVIRWKLNGQIQYSKTFHQSLVVANPLSSALQTEVIFEHSYLDLLSNTLEFEVIQVNGQNDTFINNNYISIVFNNPMSGIYTIGKNNSDFSSLSDAVNALQYNGMNADVNLKMHSGDYSESVLLWNIYKTQSNIYLTIESLSGNKDVKLISHGFKDYTIKLQNINNVRVHNLVIENRNVEIGKALHISENCNSIEIVSNTLKVDSFNISNKAALLIGNYPSEQNIKLNRVYTGSNYLIQDNIIQGGYYGLSISSRNDSSVIIRNNRILSVFKIGMLVTGITNLEVHKNKVIFSRAASNTSIGYKLTNIFAKSQGQTKITSNYVVNAGLSGMILDSVLGNLNASSNYIRIYNNMIAGGYSSSMNTNNRPIAVNLINSGNLYFVNNSIVMDAKLSANQIDLTTALNIHTTSSISGIHLYNNNLINQQSGYALYVSSTSSQSPIAASDNNNLWVANLDSNLQQNHGFVYYMGVQSDKLQFFRLSSNTDFNSISRDPVFFSNYDLHTFSENIKNKGVSFPQYFVFDDYDGESRNNIGNPDIGCDESPLVWRDFAITTVRPNVFALNTANEWEIEMRYNGSIPSQTTLYLSYKIDDVEQLDADSFILVDVPALRDFKIKIPQKYSIYRTASSSFKLTVFIKAGNIGDLYSKNDTISTIVNLGLSGLYTINKNQASIGRNFNSISDALLALNQGIGDDVIFELDDGVYNERIVIDNTINTDENRQLTFRSKNSASATKIIYNSTDELNQSVILLNGASYVNIQNLTIENTNPINAICVQFSSAAHHNKLQGNILKLDSSLSNLTEKLYVIAAARFGKISYLEGQYSSSNYNIIQNNIISGGYIGVYLSGSNQSNSDQGNIVQRNYISGYKYIGLHALYSNLNLSRNVIIGNNYVQRENSWGIRLENLGSSETSDTLVKVESNKIFGSNNVQMAILNCKGYRNQNNSISTFLISNNMIGGQTQNVNSVQNLITLNLKRSNNISIVNNTLVSDAYRTPTNNLTANTNKILVVDSSNHDIIAYNNVLYSNTGAVPLDFFSQISTSSLSKSGLLNSDNNLIFTTINEKYAYTPLVLIVQHTNLAGTQQIFSFHQGTQSASTAFSQFKKYSYNSNREQSTIIEDLKFLNFPFDLHTEDLTIYKKSKLIPTIISDFDGQKRSALKYDIGADEMMIFNKDIEVLSILNTVAKPNGLNKIKLILKNKSINPIINQELQLNYKIYDEVNNVIATDIDTITLNFNKFSEELNYTFKDQAYLGLSNSYRIVVWINSIDDYTLNDTLSSIICKGFEGDLFVGFSGYPFFPNTNQENYFDKISDAIEHLECGIASNVTIHLNPLFGPYQETIVIEKINTYDDDTYLVIQPYFKWGNTATVELNYNDNFTSNPDYVLELKNANNVLLKNIVFRNYLFSEKQKSIIQLTENSRNIIIDSCEFQHNNMGNVPVIGVSFYVNPVYLNYSERLPRTRTGQEIKIVRCTFRNLTYGVYLDGASTEINELGNKIDSNKFINISNSAIYVNNHSVLSIQKNIIESTNTTLVNTAINIESMSLVNNCVIDGNQIISYKRQGLRIRNVMSELNKSLIVSNNFIYGADPVYNEPTNAAVIIMNSNNVGIYHNSIKYKGSKSAIIIKLDSIINMNTFPIKYEYLYSKNLKILNNIIIVDTALAINTIPNLIECYNLKEYTIVDYNVYYNPNANRFAASLSGKHLSFLDWKNKTGYDQHSIFSNIRFINTTSPEIRDSIVVIKSGIAVDDVTEDFYNRLRNPRIADIGAISYTAQNRNLSLFAIQNEKFLINENNIEVTLLNEGIEDISQYNINLQFSLDSGRSWSAEESVNLYQLNSQFKLQKHVFTSKVFINNYEKIKLFVRITPQGRLPGDSILESEVIRKDICIGLYKGEYTVGQQPNLDFSKLSVAISALECGFDSSIVIKINEGIYKEQLKITGLKTKQNKHVIFRGMYSNSDKIVLESDLNYNLKIKNSNYIEFENLKFFSNKSSNFTQLYIEDSCSSISFVNCKFELPILAIQSPNLYHISNQSNGNSKPSNNISQLFVDRSEFIGASSSIYFIVNNSDKISVIKNSVFNKVFNKAMYFNGFRIDSVLSNQINLIDNGSSTGIEIMNLTYDFFIDRNHIVNPNRYGIGLENIMTSNKSQLINNSIIGGKNSDVQASGLINIVNSGEFVSNTNLGSGIIELLHNSVLTNSNYTADAALNVYRSKRISLINNIFASYSNALAFKHEQLIQNLSCYEETGINLIFSKGMTLAKWNSTNCTTLQELQIMDQNRAPFRLELSPKNLGSIDPKFKSNSDLHINNLDLNNSASQITYQIFDIDNELRDLNQPDIGSDEFEFQPDLAVIEILKPLDEMTYLGEGIEITAKIWNYGRETDNAKVYCMLDGRLVDSFIINSSNKISYNDSILVDFTSINLYKSGKHNLTVYSIVYDNVQGNYQRNDFNYSNDTFSINFYTIDSSDLIVSKFNSPNTQLNGNTLVDVSIYNDGTIKVKDFNLELYVDDELKEVKRVSSYVNPYTTINQTFDFRFGNSPKKDYNICVNLVFNDDVNPANNKLCISKFLSTGFNSEHAMDIVFYPNISKDFIYVNGIEEYQYFDLKIFDAKGGLIQESIIDKNSIIDLRLFAEGIYYFNIENRLYKIIKQN